MSWLRDCYTSEDPTFPRKMGRMCGARAVHVVEDVAYVVSELSHTLSVVRLPGRLSNDLAGLPPTTIQPEFIGSLQDSWFQGKGAR